MVICRSSGHKLQLYHDIDIYKCTLPMSWVSTLFKEEHHLKFKVILPSFDKKCTGV